MGHVGFGSYRISTRSQIHRRSLIHALSEGCKLIGTSSNYTDGESEELIGEVLQEFPNFRPLIVTKAGYIQGKNLKVLADLNKNGLALDDLVDLGENLKHSIHPEFLKSQLEQSLLRLKKESIDYFLLHNPEYYFDLKDSTRDEYYSRLKKAFIYCEEEVSKGRIKAYGISSNNFVLPLDHPHVTDLSKILKILEEVNAVHFKMVQFPFNLIEIGALEKLGDYGDQSLLELCQKHELVSVINRPLNAFTQNKLVRLATYEEDYASLNDNKAREHFDCCLNLIKEKWDESTDEIVDANDFFEVEMIKQFRQLWNSLPSPDAVEQVYYGHIFPFIARVWGNDLSVDESRPFYELLELSLQYSRKNMSETAVNFKKQAQSVGLLPLEEDRKFAVLAIETYLDYGFDYVLVGMRKPEYVDQLKHLF